MWAGTYSTSVLSDYCGNTFHHALAHLVLRYSLISATTLYNHASAHLVLWYSLISATTFFVSASTLLLCAMEPQYYTVPSSTYCAVSYSFLITGLGSQIVI